MLQRQHQAPLEARGKQEGLKHSWMLGCGAMLPGSGTTVGVAALFYTRLSRWRISREQDHAKPCKKVNRAKESLLTNQKHKARKGTKQRWERLGKGDR